MITIERSYTDMAKYGMTGKYRHRVDTTIKRPGFITTVGKYFPSKQKAKAHMKELA